MDVDLPQEDIGYVRAASLNDALTYIPFTPPRLPPLISSSPLVSIHFHLDHPFEGPFNLLSHKWESSDCALDTSSSVCTIFSFFFSRGFSFLRFSSALLEPLLRAERFTSASSPFSRHPTPQMRLQISYVYSLIVPCISSPLVHLSSQPRCPHQLSATHRPPTSMQ